MDSVIGSAIKDLLKYKIVAYVNTGDKTFDNLLNTFLLALVTYLFSVFSLPYLLMRYRMHQWSKKQKDIKLDQSTFEYYTTQIKIRKLDFRYVTWMLGKEGSEGSIFAEKVGFYYMKNLGWRICRSFPSVMDPKSGQILRPLRTADDGSGFFHIMSESIEHGDNQPLFIHNGEIVAITKQEKHVLFMHTNEEAYNVFIKMINNLSIPTSEPFIKKQCTCKEEEDSNGDTIYTCECDCKKDITCDCKCTCNDEQERYQPVIKYIGHTDTTYTIYPDRSLNMIVSRHKAKILSLLENFIATNKGKPRFGGFGSYNFGMILYGAPGTGKTMMIKAICNYLKRDAFIIDMRKIKTKTDLTSILFNANRVKNNVFVFDEFDCVQDVIKIRGNTSEFNNESKKDTMHELKERQLRILALMSSRVCSFDDKSNKDKSNKDKDPLAVELENIKQEIKDRENGLTLDTMLTILDGVIEMRNRVVIATTNHIDAIDPALIREGRFDIKIELSAFDNNESHEILEKLFKNDATSEEFEYLRKTRLRENEFTPVEIINLSVSYKSLRKVVDIMKVPVD